MSTNQQDNYRMAENCKLTPSYKLAPFCLQCDSENDLGIINVIRRMKGLHSVPVCELREDEFTAVYQ
jgi:hypothetical protein